MTSCNTATDPSMMLTAGLVAKKAPKRAEAQAVGEVHLWLRAAMPPNCCLRVPG